MVELELFLRVAAPLPSDFLDPVVRVGLVPLGITVVTGVRLVERKAVAEVRGG